MGFFDDIGSGLGAILNPMSIINPTDVVAQAGNLGVGLATGSADLGQTLGIKNGFQGALAPITNPITNEQLQTGLGQGAQAVTAQQTLASQLANPNIGLQQQDLANALLAQSQGQGPNPAQAQLAQNTSNNIAQQAALMAGQRGAGANAGLVARNAANAGGDIQQNAVGQAATLQAQQQLAAQQALQQQQQAIANQAMQSQGAATNAALGQQGQLLGAQGQFNQSQVANYGGVNDANSRTAAGNADRNAKAIGGLLGGIGSIFGLAHGGQVAEEYAHMYGLYHGGKVDAMVSPGEKYLPPQEAQKVLSGDKEISQAGEKIKGQAKVKGDSQKNDTVPKKLDAGGVVIPRSVMDKGEKASLDFLKDALRKGDTKKEESDFHMALKRAISSRGK